MNQITPSLAKIHDLIKALLGSFHCLDSW